MTYLFTFIFELIFSFIFEGSYELSKEKSIPKWLRITFLIIFLLSTSSLVLGFISLGLLLVLKNDVISGSFFIIIGFLMAIGVSYSFLKEYKLRRNIIQSQSNKWR